MVGAGEADFGSVKRGTGGSAFDVATGLVRTGDGVVGVCGVRGGVLILVGSKVGDNGIKEKIESPWEVGGVLGLGGVNTVRGGVLEVGVSGKASWSSLEYSEGEKGAVTATQQKKCSLG